MTGDLTDALTRVEIDAAIAAAFQARPHFSATQTKAIGRALGMIRRDVRTEFAVEIAKLREDIAAQISAVEDQVNALRNQVDDLGADLTLLRAVTKGDVRQLRGKIDAA